MRGIGLTYYIPKGRGIGSRNTTRFRGSTLASSPDPFGMLDSVEL